MKSKSELELIKPKVRKVQVFILLLNCPKFPESSLCLHFYDENKALERFMWYQKNSDYFPTLFGHEIFVTPGHPLYDMSSPILNTETFFKR